MNVKHIVEQWLRQNGYDGLAGGCCGCGVDDLFPCGMYCGDCLPAHLASDEEITNAGDDPEEMRGHYWVSGKKSQEKNDVQ